MRVIPLPANQDNYMYLIIDDQSNKAAIVDPVDENKITSAVRSEKVELVSALVTHHHWDHAGGTEQLSQTMKQQGANSFKIYGGDATRIKAIDHVLGHEEKFTLGKLKVTALHTPCHTSSHLCYHVEDEETKETAVFTGDTLFIGGCGRFFEGTPEQMHEALNNRLSSLPNETKVYCGHEYTVANLQFAKSVDPGNAQVKEKLQWAEKERQAGRFTVPSTIGEEKTFNPFMRVGDSAMQRSLGVSDAVAAMAKLREMKNNFKG